MLFKHRAKLFLIVLHQLSRSKWNSRVVYSCYVVTDVLCFGVLFSSQRGKQENSKWRSCIYSFNKYNASPFFCVSRHPCRALLSTVPQPSPVRSDPQTCRGVCCLPSPRLSAFSRGEGCSAVSAPAGTAYNQPWVRLHPSWTRKDVTSYCFIEDLSNMVRGPDIPCEWM